MGILDAIFYESGEVMIKLGLTTYQESEKEISVSPMSSCFTIKRTQIPKLVVFLIKAYIKGFFK